MMKRLLRIGFLLFTLCALLAVLSACVADPGKTVDATTTEPITEHLHVPKIEPGSKPTCTSEGWGDRVYCAECGETLEEAEILPPRKHELVWHDPKDPTCLESGWNAYETCNNCDYTTYEELEPTSHVTLWHEPKEPTCTESGWEGYETCLLCEYTTYRELPATDHSLEYHMGEASTCEQGGYAPFEACIHCDYTTYKELEPLGHIEEYHEARAATCEENGWYAYVTCAREGCALNTMDIIPALGHNRIYHEKKSATCIEDGWYAYETCSRCTEYNTYRVAEATGHNILQCEGQDATCYDDGWFAYEVCLACTEYNTYMAIPALGHNCVQFEKKNPTCTEAGHNAYEACTRCDYNTKITEPPYSHSESTIPAIAATCEGTGYTAGVYCLLCDKVLVEPQISQPLGHDPLYYEAVPATCYESGMPAYTGCSRCNHGTPTPIAPLGHDPVYHEALAATCTEWGYDAYTTCTRCDYISSYSTHAPRGHYDGKLFTETAATCVAEGAGYIPCGGCGIRLRDVTIEIDPTAHKAVIDQGTPATCAAGGLTDGSHCELCGVTIIAQTEIPFTGLHRTVSGECVYCHAKEGTRELAYVLKEDGTYKIIGIGSYTGKDIVIGIHNDRYVTEIEPYSFKNNKTVHSVTFAKGSRCGITESAFHSCMALKSVTFASGSTSRIGLAIFAASTYLTNVTFEDGAAFLPATDSDTLPGIGGEAFASCEYLSSIRIPSTIKKIGSGAFRACLGMTSLYIPASVESTESGIVSLWRSPDNGSQMTIYIEHSTPPAKWHINWDFSSSPIVWNCLQNDVADDGYRYTVYNGVRYALKDGEATVVRQPQHIGTVRIVNGFTYEGNYYYVTSIQSYAFWYCPNLVEVYIPEGVTKTAANAFGECEAATIYAAHKSRPADWDISTFDGTVEVVYDYHASDVTGTGYIYTIVDGIRYAIHQYAKYAIVAKQPKNTTYGQIASSIVYKGVTYPVEVIDYGAYARCTQITSVSVPASIRELRSGAFNGATALSSITFAPGVSFTYLYGMTFYNTALTSITIPAGVTTIYGDAFLSCKELKSVIFADGSACTAIGQRAFEDCTALSSITIPARVESIGERIFGNCTSLSEIRVASENSHYRSINGHLYTKDGKTLVQYAVGNPATSYAIPYGTEAIGEYAFMGATLSAVVLPEGIKTIGEYAFYTCKEITAINLPSSVTYIDTLAFDKTMPACELVDGVYYIGAWVIGYDYACQTIALREGTVGFMNATFVNTTIISITFPSTIDEIPNSAFAACWELESVIFAEGSTCARIGKEAFSRCTSLKSIVIPARVTLIDECAFEASGLTAVIFDKGSNCRCIASRAFAECHSLTSITIPASVTEIGADAFLYVKALEIAEDGVYYIGNWAVGHGDSESGIFTIREGTVGISHSAFAGYATACRVAIPASTIYIANDSFQRSIGLQEITVNAENPVYRSIGGDLYTKDGKTLLQYALGKTGASFRAPDGVTTIAKHAFYEAKNLTSLDLTGIKTVEAEAFHGCTNLTYINFAGVETIGDAAFGFCTSLTTIYIPATVVNMGQSVFYRQNSYFIVYVEHPERPDTWHVGWANSTHNYSVYWDRSSAQ